MQHRIHLKAILGLGLAAAVQCVYAGTFQGSWQGVMAQGNTDVPLMVKATASTAELHIGAPLSCGTRAVFVKLDGADLIYRTEVARSTGGFCDRLVDSSGNPTIIRLHPLDPQRWTVQLDSTRAGVTTRWSGTLQPAPSP